MNQRIVVTVEDGMTYIYASGRVEVLTLDYDIGGLDAGDVISDIRGERCVVRREVTTNPRFMEQVFKHFEANEARA